MKSYRLFLLIVLISYKSGMVADFTSAVVGYQIASSMSDSREKENAKKAAQLTQAAQNQAADLRQKLNQSELLTRIKYRAATANFDPNFKDADLSGLDLSGLDLSGLDLSNANLKGAILKGTNLNSAILKGAKLKGANLKGAQLEGTDLNGADLTYVIR